MRLNVLAAVFLIVVPALALQGCFLLFSSDRFTFEDEVDAGPADASARDASEDASSNDAGSDDAGCAMMCMGVCTDLSTDPERCGSCDRACSAPDDGTATCTDAVCGFECDPGFARVLGACVEREAPRPIAPLSTATVTSRRPTLRWELAARSDGARIELCEDRACISVLQTLDAPGTSARPPTDLPAGMIFWRMFAMAEGVASPTPSVTWQFHVGARSADGDVDTSWGTTLDVNGDGFADIVVGAYAENSNDGAAYVYHGGPSGLSATAALVLSGPAGAGGQFGVSVASAGDVNGDGFADVIIGAFRERANEGAAYVYHGGPSGLSATAALVLRGPVAGGSFGISVSSAGDVNGDGFADVVLGAFGERTNEGVVYVHHGGASGLDATAALALRGPGGAGGYLGGSVASAGDVNGDGFADVVLGAIGERSGDGAAYVHHGGSSGLSSTAALVLRGPGGTGGSFGVSVASAGDVNGDGFADVIIGAHSEASYVGAAYVHHGGTSGLNAMAALVLRGPGGAAGNFGGSVANAGDVDGDGFADIVIGADGEATFDGAAYVHHGGSSGLDATAALVLRGPGGAAGNFGWSVAGAGDVNGDGFVDITIGASSERSSDGAAYAHRGSPSGLNATAALVLRGSAGTGGKFGWSVAM